MKLKPRHKFTIIGALCLIAAYCVISRRNPAPSPPAGSIPPTAQSAPAPSIAHAPEQGLDDQEDKVPELSPKVKNIVRRAISERWPNNQLCALISMTRDPELIAELWMRDPLDAHDLCVLAMHSATPDQKRRAAELWAERDPDNAEPKYGLFLERWINEKNKTGLIQEIYGLVKLGKLDSYFSDRSAAYDLLMQSHGLSGEGGIRGMDANDTHSKAMNVLNLLSKYNSEAIGAGPDEKAQLAGLTAGMARQLENRKSVTLQEYQAAVTGELRALRQLDDQTEYGSEGFTVADRKKELLQRSNENMAMSKACMDAWAADPGLAQLFRQRAQALGDYEAYRQIYALLNKSSN